MKNYHQYSELTNVIMHINSFNKLSGAAVKTKGVLI